MGQKFANNARALLASGIGAADTSLTVEAPKADLFPVANVGAAALPSVNDWFKCTLENTSGQCEIIYVRTRPSGNALFTNVMRGQEGTTARVYAAGDVIGLRMTALDVETVIGFLSANNTFTGTATFNAAATFAVQSTHTGGVKIGTNWTVTETSGSLFFATGGTNRMKLDASGNLTVSGDVTFGSGAPVV